MLGERVLTEGDAADDFAGATVRLVGSGEPVAPDDDPPAGRVPTPVAGTAIDEV